MRGAGAGGDPAHVLLVGGDAGLRDVLKRYLARHGFIATAARDAPHALRLMDGLAFDLLVIDAAMPGGDGAALTRRIREAGSAPLLLLGRAVAGDWTEALEPGAGERLALPFEPRELLLRVSALLRRSAPPPRADPAPRVLSLGDTRFDIGRTELRRDGELVRLTSAEQALMRVFSRRPGEAVSRVRLAAELGGPGAAVQERAVDVQITRLRRKIEADPKSPRYLQTVRGEGYMLIPD